MEINGEYTFDAPRDIVWNAVRDPDVLGSILPGGEGIEEVGENEYVGNLKIKVGPVQGKFKGNIALSNINEPESYDIAVDGKGAPGFVKATGDLKLSEQGDKTHMLYAGKAQVGGRIASVGQRLVESAAKSIIRQSLEGLNAYCVAQVAAQNAPPPPPEPVAAPTTPNATPTPPPSARPNIPPPPAYTPPTQTELMVNVARDIAKESPEIAFAAGAVALLVLQFFLRLLRGKK